MNNAGYIHLAMGSTNYLPPITQAALETVLQRDLATLAHQYLLPGDGINIKPVLIGLSGHAELIINAVTNDPTSNMVLAGICFGGYYELAVEVVGRLRDPNIDLGLLSACAGGHLELIKLMVAFGATMLNAGLSQACTLRHLSVVRVLIDHGATRCYCGRSMDEHRADS